MWVPQSKSASEEGKTCSFVWEKEKGGFDAPMRNTSNCPPPPAAATSRPSDLLVLFFFFFFLFFFPFPTEVPHSRVHRLRSLPCLLPPPPPTSSEQASRGLAARGTTGAAFIAGSGAVAQKQKQPPLETKFFLKKKGHPSLVIIIFNLGSVFTNSSD
jgi:hypothetical protein